MFQLFRAFRAAPRRAAAAFAVAGLSLAASGCGDSEPAAPPAPPPPEVEVLTVEPAAVALPYELPGRLEGSREVEVRARVTGILLRRTFEEGRPVERGQVLFVVDPAPYEAEVQAAEAQLAEAGARLGNAERELSRLEPLLERRAVSQRDHDVALAEVEQARAAVLSARARLAKARLDLAYTRVEAPISGRASRALFSEGSLVGPESLLTRIAQVQPIWVRFAMSDEEHLALRRAIEEQRLDAPAPEDQQVELVLADGSLHSERGRLNFSDPIIDPRTGSVDLRAELDNAGGDLVPGQFVRVRLLGIERPDTLMVPQRAVQQGQEGKLVFVVDAEGVAHARPVEVGQWIGDRWVIESGLEPGERVIVEGTARVRPGAPVSVAPGAGDDGAGDDGAGDDGAGDDGAGDADAGEGAGADEGSP